MSDLHVLTEAAGMRVVLVTVGNSAFKGFIVLVGHLVLLPVRTVREASVATRELTLKGFLACESYKYTITKVKALAHFKFEK